MTNVLHQRRNAPSGREILLRIRADLGFSLWPTKVHENPLPGFASIAHLDACYFSCQFVRLRRAEHGSPYPVWADARAIYGIDKPGWFLKCCVKDKVSADTDNDARKTGHQICAHDQSSESSSCLLACIRHSTPPPSRKVVAAIRRGRLLLVPLEATSCGAPPPI